IAYVGPSESHQRDPRVPEVDGRGKFLLPGLIDTHAHVTYMNWVAESGSPSTGHYDEEISRASLRLLLSFGITTVRNPGGPTAVAVGLREGVRKGGLVGRAI